MNLAVVGSRDWPDRPFIWRVLYRFVEEAYGYVPDEDHMLPPGEVRIVSGGARGVDTMAADWAVTNWTGLTEHVPDWDQYGRRAGYVRNELIIRDADFLLAFQWRGSRGTQHSIDLARHLGVPTVVFTESDLILTREV